MITITVDEQVRGAIRATLRNTIQSNNRYVCMLPRKKTRVRYLLATSKRGNPDVNPFFTIHMGDPGISDSGTHLCLAKLTIVGGGKHALKFTIDPGSEYFDESWNRIVAEEFYNAVSDLASGVLEDEKTTVYNTFG